MELVHLGPRLLGGAQTADDTDDVAGDSDSWRYREEAEKDTAETGNVAPPDRESSPEVRVGLHRWLRQGYLSLMKALTRRAEVIRDEKQIAGRDELLRLQFVATLVLQKTGREVGGASQCGSLVTPKDLELEILPSIAILLGRSAKAHLGSDRSDGPTLLRAGDMLSDPESKEAACVLAILLSALVAYRKQEAGGRVRVSANTEDLAGCLELVAARSFMAIEMLGALPTLDLLEQSIQSLGPGFPWLFTLGRSIVGAFQDLVDSSRRISEVENHGAPEAPLPPSYRLEPGVWVYTRSWGVTEILGIDGKSVTVAIVDGPGTDPLIRTKISRTKVRLAGMRRSW